MCNFYLKMIFFMMTVVIMSTPSYARQASWLISKDPSGIVPWLSHDYDCPFTEEEARNAVMDQLQELELNIDSIGWPGLFLYINYNCMNTKGDNIVWSSSIKFGKPAGEQSLLFMQPAFGGPGIVPKKTARKDILKAIRNGVGAMAKIFIESNK